MRWHVCVLIAGVALAGCSNGADVGGPPPAKLTFNSATQDRVDAIYETEGVTLYMRAWVEDSQIISEIARADGAVLTSLRVPNTQNIRDEAIPEAIEAAASTTTVALNKLELSADELGELKTELRAAVDEVYIQTPNLQGQMRLVLGYHGSIISAAQVTGDGHVNLLAGGGGTPCTEEEYDPSIPFHYEEDHAGGAVLARAGVPTEDHRDMRVDGTEEATACLLGKASSWGCCGNYSGCCYYWHPVCYAHDWICSSCGHWYCGPQCKPG